MRCPNCGNENPPDYAFCDECGARLTADTGTGGVDTDVSSTLLQAADAQDGQSPGSQAAMPDGGNMAGGEPLPGGQQDHTPMEPYMGQMAGGVSSAQDASAAGSGLDVPLTEDTAGPVAQSVASGPGQTDIPSMVAPQAEAEQNPMPDVTPISEQDQTASQVMQQAEPAAPISMNGTSSAGSAGGSWAHEALDHLENAQQSMAKGDWASFAQHMSTLKSVLQSAAMAAPATTTRAAEALAAQSAPIVSPGYAEPAPAPAIAPMTAAPEPSEAQPAGQSTPPVEATAPSVTEIPGIAQAGSEVSSNGTARLVVIATGAELPLPEQEEITVGREDPSSGIFPDVDLTPYGGEDGGVSRRHARLLHMGNDYFVEDLQSTNYTKLDGQRLPAHVRERLEDGTRLDFGRVAVIFRRS